jgi:hypothetical protein
MTAKSRDKALSTLPRGRSYLTSAKTTGINEGVLDLMVLENLIDGNSWVQKVASSEMSRHFVETPNVSFPLQESCQMFPRRRWQILPKTVANNRNPKVVANYGTPRDVAAWRRDPCKNFLVDVADLRIVVPILAIISVFTPRKPRGIKYIPWVRPYFAPCRGDGTNAHRLRGNSLYNSVDALGILQARMCFCSTYSYHILTYGRENLIHSKRAGSGKGRSLSR